MYNWTVDENKLKGDKEGYAVWKLEQTANFGLNGTKLKKKELKKHWSKLRLDPARKKFLELLLYE